MATFNEWVLSGFPPLKRRNHLAKMIGHRDRFVGIIDGAVGGVAGGHQPVFTFVADAEFCDVMATPFWVVLKDCWDR